MGAKRRLEHFRSQLHDPVKRSLGENRYEDCFRETRFAHAFGPPGTSRRLDRWCVALASHISYGRVPPSVAALTLRFCGAPQNPVVSWPVASDLCVERLQSTANSAVSDTDSVTDIGSSTDNTEVASFRVDGLCQSPSCKSTLLSAWKIRCG